MSGAARRKIFVPLRGHAGVRPFGSGIAFRRLVLTGRVNGVGACCELARMCFPVHLAEGTEQRWDLDDNQ